MKWVLLIHKSGNYEVFTNEQYCSFLFGKIIESVAKKMAHSPFTITPAIDAESMETVSRFQLIEDIA